MSLTLLETLLWAAGSLLNAALLCCLLFRRRFRTLPWFTAWIAFGSLFSLFLYLSHTFGPRTLYAVTYWSGAFVDMLFQIAVVLEIGRLVLRRNGQWVEGAGRRLLLAGGAGAVAATVLALGVKPADTAGLDLWTTRGNIFTAILVCTLFTGVVAASQQLGLGWRSHAIRVGYGLTFWALAAFALDSLHGYFGPHRYAKGIDYVEKLAYVASLIYWLVSLWPEEPSSKNISASERKRILALGEQLQFRSSGTPRSADGVFRK